MTDHLLSLGEIKSEWHEGAPDWALAPPKFIDEVFLNKILLMEKRYGKRQKHWLLQKQHKE